MTLRIHLARVAARSAVETSGIDQKLKACRPGNSWIRATMCVGR